MSTNLLAAVGFLSAAGTLFGLGVAWWREDRRAGGLSLIVTWLD